jgi:hypothetical protein
VARVVERYLLGPDSTLRPRGPLRLRMPEDTTTATRIRPRIDTSHAPPRPIAGDAGR